MKPPKSFKAVKIASKKNATRTYKTGQTTRVRRSDPYAEDWNDIRKRVHAKYGGRCCKCQSTDRLEVHHIIRVARGGRNSIANLILLCHSCHKKQPGHGHMH